MNVLSCGGILITLLALTLPPRTLVCSTMLTNYYTSKGISYTSEERKTKNSKLRDTLCTTPNPRLESSAS